MEIIALTGRKGSGKDTAVQPLVDGLGFTVVKFADPLKKMLAVLLSYQGADDQTIQRMLEGDLKETPTELLQGRTPRHAMQTLGTEWGRQLIGDNLWTDAAKRRCLEAKRAVVTDMRFPNEFNAMEELGAKTFRIERPDLELNESSAHVSESYIDFLPVGNVIVNDRGVEELQYRFVSAVFQ